MSLNTVTLTFTEQDAGSGAEAGSVKIQPTTTVIAAGQTVVSQDPVIRSFGSGTVSVQLVATDNAGTSPAKGFWAYQITLPGWTAPQTYLVDFANGATQRFDSLTPAVEQTAYSATTGGGTSGFTNPMTTLGDLIYEDATPAANRLPGNTGSVMQVLASTGTGSAAQAPAWKGAAQSGRTGSTPGPYDPLLFGGVWGYPHKFYPESYGASPDAVIVDDCVVSAGALTSLTSASGKFTAGTKKIMLNGGQGADAQPLICPVTYVNAGALTLGTASSQALTNAQAVVATDYTAQLRSCFADAGTYAAKHGDAQILLSGFFGAATPPTVLSGNSVSTTAQLPIPHPAADASTASYVLSILGLGPADDPMYFASPMPGIQGSGIISMCIPPSPSSTVPMPSVIGLEYAADGSLTGGFANVKVVVDGITVVIPFLGPQGAFDFWYCRGAGGGRAAAKEFGAPSAGAYNNLQDLPSLAGETGGSSFGLRMPKLGNNDDCTWLSFLSEGFTQGSVISEHSTFLRLGAIYPVAGIVCQGGGAHGAYIGMASVETAFAAVQCQEINPFPLVIGYLDTEGVTTWHFEDTQGGLRGRALVHTNNASPPLVSDGCGLEIIWDGQSRTVQGAPTYTLGTAFRNPWWHHATITIAGGTVTGVKVGASSTSLTSLGITSGTFRLPSGYWLEIDGSVKPTTFVAVPD